MALIWEQRGAFNPHPQPSPQICRLCLQQELQPRAHWCSICFTNVIISQHWFLTGIDQYPEMLRSQTLQKKKYPTPQSRSVIKMTDHQVQYFLKLQRRLANILQDQVWPLRRVTSLCLLEPVMGGICTLGHIFAFSKGSVGSRAWGLSPFVGNHTLAFHHKVLEQWAQNTSTTHWTQWGDPRARKFCYLSIYEGNIHQAPPLCLVLKQNSDSASSGLRPPHLPLKTQHRNTQLEVDPV